MTTQNPFQRAAAQTQPQTKWQASAPAEYQPQRAPEPELTHHAAGEPGVFKCGDEVLHVTNDEYIARFNTGPGKYDPLFAALKEGQRIVCQDKKQTDRIARALDSYLRKTRKEEFSIRSVQKHPIDGLAGVWYFAKVPPKSQKNAGGMNG